MRDVSLGMKRSVVVRRALALAFTFALFTAPSVRALTVQPVQVLPPSPGTSCSAVTFSELQPHIYDGNLDSFDVTISDGRYVAVLATINDSPIEYRYITRWNNADGSVRLHIDIASLRMNHDVTVSAVLMASATDPSSKPVTCLINYTATIAAAESPVGESRAPIYIPVLQPDKQVIDSETDTSSIDTEDASIKNTGLVAVTSSLGKLCTNGGSSKLWFILLLLYAVFVVTLLAQKVEPGDLGKEWNIALVLGIFLALLVFWYASPVCRAGPWAPATATLIAIGGMIYTMFQPDPAKDLLLLKDGSK